MMLLIKLSDKKLSLIFSAVQSKMALAKIRKRLGVKFTKELEEKTYRVLIDKKILKAKGRLVDATVVPEKIKYPNDVKRVNDVREWLVSKIRRGSVKTGEKIRTYRRKAKKLYLNFAKKKQKTRKMIERTKKQMLQYVRRNLEQLKKRIESFDFLEKVVEGYLAMRLGFNALFGLMASFALTASILGFFKKSDT